MRCRWAASDQGAERAQSLHCDRSLRAASGAQARGRAELGEGVVGRQEACPEQMNAGLLCAVGQLHLDLFVAGRNGLDLQRAAPLVLEQSVFAEQPSGQPLSFGDPQGDVAPLLLEQ